MRPLQTPEGRELTSLGRVTEAAAAGAYEEALALGAGGPTLPRRMVLVYRL